MTVAFKHVHKAPPPPGRLNPQLPEEWERVILVCLAKDPTHRFQTAASLESAIAALDVSARVTGQQQPGLGQDGPAGSETPREMALGHETRTLLEQGRTKEQSGQLQDALRDYRVALTVASPGPLRDELNQGVARVTARIAEETDSGALPEGQSPEAQAAPTGRAGRPAPGRRDRRVWAGGAALLLTLVVALLLLVRPGRGSSISAAALHAHQTATAASATSTSTALIAAAPLYPRTLHGPGAGTLTDPGPSTVAMGQGSPPTRDFVAQVRFHNPRDRSRWDYGLAFRNIGRDAQYRLVIAWDRKWYLGYGTGAPTASRFTGSIRLGPGQVNELRATVKGKLLRFTVNGHRVADARLSKMQSGSVRPIMDIFLADTLTGRVLRYGQFSVWSSPPTYGPLSGALNHRLDPNNVDYAGAGVQVRDFVAEARFVNPYPSSEHRWDYGFMFRETGRNQQYRLTVTPDRHWSFAYGSGQDLREGSLTALNAGARESNYLRLVVKGNLAVFFVNGVRVATLDVSEKMGAGNVDVVTGNLPGDEVQGKATRYKNFVVWSLDR